MSTAAQVLANRQNAVQSSGPKTPEGKAASSQNATRHGLSGHFSVLPHESVEEFEGLAARLGAEFHPEGENETFLVHQMIQARWKLARIERLEALAFEQILTEPSAEDDPDTRLLGAMGRNGNILDKLARYSAAAERSYFKALRELQASRARNHKAEASALDAYIKNFINAPIPTPDFAKFQNEPNSRTNQAAARPNLTPEELSHPALRL